MVYTKVGGSAGSGKISVINNLHRNNIGDSVTVVGAASNIRGVYMGYGILGGR